MLCSKIASKCVPSNVVRPCSSILKRGNFRAMATNDASESIDSLRRQIGDLKLQLKRKEEQAAAVAPYSQSFSRTMIASILESDNEGVSMTGQTIRVGGWVKTGRTAGGGAFAFLELNDGSCFANMQVMVDKEVGDAVGGLKEMTSTATCVLVEGQLAETPEGTKQKVWKLPARSPLCTIVPERRLSKW